MEVFRQAWENQVRILTEAVDDIVTVDDFLAVSENHILEDVNKCCLALQERDSVTLDRIAGLDIIYNEASEATLTYKGNLGPKHYHI